MTSFYRKAFALGTAAAIATASGALAGPIGPAGTQVKQAVPSTVDGARFRRGASIAAGAAIGLGVAAAASAAYSYNYGYGYGYGYGSQPYGYYDNGGYYDDGYAAAYGYGPTYGYTPSGYGYCDPYADPSRPNAC